ILDSEADIMEQRKYDIVTSIVILIITGLLVSHLIVNTITKPRLYDGTINDLGRYAFTFDAYDYIEDNSDKHVIAIGSSKMREIFDGVTIGGLTNYSGDFFNLAYAQDRPYVRMIEIDALIKTEPEMVIIEIGPNVFSELVTPIPKSTQGRMSQLMALNTEWTTQSWEQILVEEDRNVLPNSRFEQVRYFANYTPEAIETTINYELELEEQPYSCDPNWGTVHCVPPVDSDEYDDYIRYPIQFRNSLKVIKEGNAKYTIEEFYGERLNNYLNSSYHNPEGIRNKNQIAFEFIIEKLINNDIEVVLVALPYNPVLIDRLFEGKWDYYNSTISAMELNYDITVIDYLWDDSWVEDDFNDFTHASREGEIKFAIDIAPKLDDILQ
nr:hypothetical protein [Candidatus Poseidoniaceae archaeon]